MEPSASRRVGLLVGRENTFPGRFLDANNARGHEHGVTAELALLGGAAELEEPAYGVLVDRISHEVPYYRAHLKSAALLGAVVVNDPFWWEADEKFFECTLARRLGVAVPRTVVLPNKEYMSSPFWAGRDTGLQSYRSVIWSRFPRTGIPPEFTSYDEYENYLELLVKTGSVNDGKKIWWDLRAHPYHPTLEFRCCDQTTRLEETICMAALFQAICAKLLRLRERNLGFRKYMPALIAENKWRAMRYGLEGRLIDFGKQAEVPMRELAMELLEFVDDVVDELGSRAAVEHVHVILSEGTSADRQRRARAASASWAGVVDHLCAETAVG